MARNNKAIKSLKDVALEGQTPAEEIARHQAYMNRVNAEAKSLQQTINYAVSLGQHDKFKEFTIEKGASVTAVPYHPGAAKYFAEKGITVATK